MKLLICDREKEDLEKAGVAERFDRIIGFETSVASRFCTGCFGCWVKTPGRCVLPDELQDMGPLLATCDQVTVLSKATFGSFSPEVKKMLDRAIPYLHSYFEIREGSMHHRRRHANVIALDVVAYGDATTDERRSIERLAAANALNFDATLTGVRFAACPEAALELAGNQSLPGESSPKARATATEAEAPKPASKAEVVTLINGSPKGKRSATAVLLDDLSTQLEAGDTSLSIERTSCTGNKQPDSRALLQSDIIVLGFPLYVDTLPAHVLKLLCQLEETVCAAASSHTTLPTIYALSNCGFYEAEQIEPAFDAVRNFCIRTGFHWGGGAAIGAGGMIEPTSQAPRNNWVRRPTSNALDTLAKAITSVGFCEGSATSSLPRFAYQQAAHMQWRSLAKQNNKANLNARPTL